MARRERNAQRLVDFRLVEDAELDRIDLELIGQLVHRRLGGVEPGHRAGAAHVGRCADVALGAAERHAQVGHAVLERRGLAAVFVVVVEHRPCGRRSRAGARRACRRGVAPRRTRCWVRGRWPTVWNIILRLTTSFTGLPSCRAAAAASGQCVHGHSLPPKPEPTNFVMTRTFSFGKPNICASTPRRLTTPCDDSYSVSVESIPDRGRRVQLEGVVRLGRRDVGLVELDRRARERAVGDRRAGFAGAARGPNVVTTTSGSSSAFRSVSTFGFSLAYVARTASAAALAVSNVSATASAMYWP